MAPAWKPAVVGVVLVVALGIGLTTATPQRGESAPSVVARSLRNGHEKIVVPGPTGRPTVILFFASWCRLCEGELRNVEFVRREVGGQVDFIGVNFSDQRRRAMAIVKKIETGFPIVEDRSGAVAARFGVSGVPTSVFIDVGGRIVERHHGYDFELVDKLRHHFGVEIRPPTT